MSQENRSHNSEEKWVNSMKARNKKDDGSSRQEHKNICYKYEIFICIQENKGKYDCDEGRKRICKSYLNRVSKEEKYNIWFVYILYIFTELY